MIEPDGLPLRHLGAVHDRGVVELVEEHHVLAAHQAGNQPHVGVVAGGEDDAVFLAEEFGQRRFELKVEVEGPVQEPAPGTARPIALQRVPGCFQDLGVVGKSEIIVGPQHDSPLALDDHLGVFGFGDWPEIRVQPGRLYLVGAGVQSTLFEERDVGLNGPGRHVTSRSGEG